MSRLERKSVLHPQDRAAQERGAGSSAGTGIYTLVAFLIGVLLLVIAHRVGGTEYSDRQTLVEILREFAMVLVSVFGVSFFYEKFSAEEHFKRFQHSLKFFVARGESNAARCEALGIEEIYESREQFQERHSFEHELLGLGEGDCVRLTGRSLMNAMHNWGQFETMLRAGARLQLCMCDPDGEFEALGKVSRYFAEETRMAVTQFERGMLAWLHDQPDVHAQVELRFHRIDLMDTLVEIHHGSLRHVALDLNFGTSVEQRYIFYVDGEKPLGERLIKRADAIWEMATPHYVSPWLGKEVKSA